MNLVKAYLFFSFLFLIQSVYCQINIPWNNYIDITIDPKHRMYLDPIQLDTFHANNYSDQYYMISLGGVELMRGSTYGGMGTRCGCVPRPHGQWLARYRNGALKETGVYDCNWKTGTWIYYYENGNIAKVETWVYPYFEFATESAWPNAFGARENLLKGDYIEYYDNGKPKIEGKYEIVEVHNQIDSIIRFNPHTYEDIKIPIDGKYWVRKSVKVGIWKEFQWDGSLIKMEEFNPFYKDDIRIRPIGNNYYKNHQWWSLLEILR